MTLAQLERRIAELEVQRLAIQDELNRLRHEYLRWWQDNDQRRRIQPAG